MTFPRALTANLTGLSQDNKHVDQEDVPQNNPKYGRGDEFRVAPVGEAFLEGCRVDCPEEMQSSWNFCIWGKRKQHDS